MLKDVITSMGPFKDILTVKISKLPNWIRHPADTSLHRNVIKADLLVWLETTAFSLQN